MATARGRLLAGLPAGASVAIAGLVALAIATYFWRAEGARADALFGGLVAMTLGCGVLLATRRSLFAAVAIALLVAAIHTVSVAKQTATGITLHAFDVVRSLGSPVALGWEMAGLWTAHRGTVAGWLAAGLAAVALAGLAWRLDGSRVRRSRAAMALVVGIVATAWLAETRGPRRHTEFYFEDIYVSTFFASWSETAVALWRGGPLAAAPRQALPPLAVPATCEPTTTPPDIILIHQESVVPPELFPTLGYDKTVDAMFRSHDNRLHRLRVETYGGASWLTEFAVLTGLSAADFGGLRQLVQPLLAGRIRETLPQALARCGYRNVLFYPMLRAFMSADRVFGAMGFAQIVDARDQGAKRANERDHFYYNNMLDLMQRHFAASRQPLFAFIQTMATHGDYRYVYDAGVAVPGGGPGTHPEMHEYLRRLGMAARDYADLKAALASRFPGRPFLIVHYGDHQPLATRTLLGMHPDANVEAGMASDNPLRLVTYYAVDAVGYTPPPPPTEAMLDVPYLGTILLEAAGLPLSDTYRERRRLLRLCAGRYRDCPARPEILRFHRRLLDAGIVAP